MKNIKKILITIFTILIISTNISFANNTPKQQAKKEVKIENVKEAPKETPKETPKKNNTDIQNTKPGNVKEVMNKDKIKMFGRNNRQFVSFTTIEGQIFYLLIDYDKNGIEQNVEILKKISNEDINKIEQNKLNDPGESFEETKNENIKIQPELKEKNVEKNDNEIKQEKKEKKDFNILDYAIYIVVIIVMIVILYLKKSKKNNNMEDNFNDEENDEEMTEL
ncbi:MULTISPECIES: CD1107 family mobile element protein [Helcococcus]|uniref:CD1107 family mobile element protein n=1 Tax=Helcococcus bovis TaxID=3153252 RepID=A0ABW9F6Q9_9FIRM